MFTYSNYNVFKNAQRIKAVNGDKTQTIGFGYDMMNNLTSESNSESDHSVSYSYDFLGRLIKQDGFYVVNEYAYDTLSNRTSLTLNRQAISGNLYEISAQSYTYDTKSRLTESTAFDKTVEYSYNESDQITRKQMGILKTQRNRNSKNLVTREFISEPIDDMMVKLYHEVDYTYDYKSDLTIEDLNNSRCSRYYFTMRYEYDGAGRLKDGSLGDNNRLGVHERTYSYDGNGNIKADYKGYNGQLGSTGTRTTYPYELNNHIWGLSWLYDENNTQKGFQVFESDSNGNRYKDAGKTAEFDLFNRMVKYTDENGAETTYTYTASGLRESKTTSDGVQTFYVWDGGNMVLEYVVTDPNNLVGEYRKFYIYGADGLAYRKDLDGSIYTYNTNYRGDVLSVMDEEQNIKAEYIYDAYGNLVESNIAAGFSDNFGYRGEYHDPESGYIYLRNRYLDPKTGSFTTEDPIRDGLNWFSYCGGNPVKFTDPWGLAITCDEANSERIISLLREVSGNSLEFEYKDGQINITKTYDTKNHVGQTLVSDLINASETVNVNIGVDRDGNTNTEWPASGNDPMQIFIDPDNATGNGLFTTYTQDADGNVLEEVIPAYIVFGHELIHSWRDIRGLDVPSRDMVGLIPQDSPQLWREEELQTMGINYTDATGNPMRNYGSYVGIISENGLRLENGLNVRISYYGW